MQPLFLLFLLLAFSGPASAVPYFARKYNLNCSRCHMLPPMLNQYGQRFVANGYKLADLPLEARSIPLALWVTQRVELDQELGLAKGFPNRVELISSDAVTSWLSYFVEWRTLSYQTTAGQRLLGRHGRFEDVFIQFWLPRRTAITVGQFRMLNQWDVSRRLSLSEPLAYSAGLGGQSSGNRRLQGLRTFSLAGRAPAVRATFQTFGGGSESNGWFHEMVVPFSGELTAPLGEQARRNASFQAEGRPKGFLYETYYRKGISSVGGAFFLGRDRSLANATGVLQAGQHSLLATLGTAKFRNGLRDFRLTAGDTWVPKPWLGLGARLDHQTALRRRPAVVPHINFSFPATKYTFLLVLEQRIQQNNMGAAVEISAVF